MKGSFIWMNSFRCTTTGNTMQKLFLQDWIFNPVYPSFKMYVDEKFINHLLFSCRWVFASDFTFSEKSLFWGWPIWTQRPRFLASNSSLYTTAERFNKTILDLHDEPFFCVKRLHWLMINQKGLKNHSSTKMTPMKA